MDLTLTAEQRDLRDGLRAYLKDAWAPDRLRAASDAPGLDRREWSALSDMGVFAVLAPETDGGLGLGTVDAAIVFEELGRALVPGPLTATLLAADHLPAARAGEAVVTAVDLRDHTLLAEHPDSSTHLILVDDDGLFLLPANALPTPPAARPLDPLTPVAALPGGLVASERGERIGSASDARRWRLRGAVLTAALQTGIAQGALDLAVRYVKERTQFGRPVGSFQAVKHLLADCLVRTDLARATVHAAALTIEAPETGDPDEAAAAAKVLADDAAVTGGRTCVQVHGGMGFTWEVLAHLYLKRAWLLETGYGSAHEHALRLAEAL
ncbi:acyl-CoA dehydrogenase family protein [Streptomyces sp. NPDC002896]|uniref:acyl-CoA dehydrogenase family protein n=1 Tax=Streptomyces sp. NPDC002896 TaxID=3154438 RepID=UPI00332713B9